MQEPLIDTRLDTNEISMLRNESIEAVKANLTVASSVKNLKKSIADLDQFFSIDKTYLKSGVVSACLNAENSLVFAITKNSNLIQFSPLEKQVTGTLHFSNYVLTCIVLAFDRANILIGTNEGRILVVKISGFRLEYVINLKEPIKAIASNEGKIFVLGQDSNVFDLTQAENAKKGDYLFHDTKFISCRKEGTIFMGGRKEIRCHKTFFGVVKIYETRDEVTSVFHTHKFLLALLKSNICEIINLETGVITDDLYLIGHPTYVIMSPDETVLIVGDYSGAVYFYDIEYPQRYIKLQMSSRPITFLYIMKETDQIYAFSSEIRVAISSIPKFKKFNSFKAYTPYFMFINDHQLIYQQKGIFSLYDIHRATSRPLLKAHSLSPVFTFIPPCHLVSTAEKSLIFLNISNSKLSRFNYTKNLYTRAFSLCPETRSLAFSLNSRTIIVFDLVNFNFSYETGNHGSEIKTLTYCCSKTIASGTKNQIILWDIELKSMLDSGEELESCIEELLVNLEYLYAATEACFIYIWNWKLRLIIYKLDTTHTTKITKLWIGNENLITSSTEKITFWDLKTHSRVFSSNIILKNDVLDISPSGNTIAYSTGSNLLFMENPYSALEFEIFGGTENELNDFVKTVNSIYKLKKISHDPKYNEWIIMPYRMNIGHIYALTSLDQNLKDFISTGGTIINTQNNQNILSYCIEKNLDSCTFVIVNELKKRLASNPFAFSFITHEMLQDLNLKGSELLSKLYELVYIQSSQNLIEKFCSEGIRLPTFYHSAEFEITQSNFFVNNPENLEEDAVPVEYKQSLVKLTLDIGSAESKSFLKSLIKCRYTNIFTTPLVQDILLEKWMKLRWLLYTQGAVYTIHLFFYGVILFNPDCSIVFSLILFAFNFILTVYEFYQAYVLIFEYFTDPWNLIDFSRFVLMNILLVLYWSNGQQSEVYFYISSALTILVFLRGLSYFRLAEQTRYIVDLIQECVVDMLGFSIVFTFSIISFAFIFYSLEEGDNRTSLYANIINSYLINFGPSDPASGILFNALYFLATVINPIIMLNLLISILGNTFSRVEETRVISNYKEMAKLIYEIEQICPVKQGRSTFLQSCSSPEDVQIPDTVLAKIKKLSLKLVSLSSNFESTSAKVDLIFENTCMILKGSQMPSN